MRLKITEPAEKDLCRLDRRTEKRIRAVLDNLLIDPRSVDLSQHTVTGCGKQFLIFLFFSWIRERPDE